MVAFSPNQLPSSVNTLEKLAAWLGAALYDTSGGAQVQYTDSITGNLTIQQRITPGGFRDAAGVWNVSYTLFLPAANTIFSGSSKPWTHVNEVSQVQIPATFNS